MESQLGPDFGSYLRRGNRRLVDYVTVNATQKTDKKITKMVFHLTEIALGIPTIHGFSTAMCPSLAPDSGVATCSNRGRLFLLVAL